MQKVICFETGLIWRRVYLQYLMSWSYLLPTLLMIPLILSSLLYTKNDSQEQSRIGQMGNHFPPTEYILDQQ